ncbi:MAG TPA: tetratricopeptide repeat protein [Rhizomicrobium sp.]|jgi:TPR repeat protein|nr:tetratricopeptide repeat protein [Rhizomicrobium sp.]
MRCVVFASAICFFLSPVALAQDATPQPPPIVPLDQATFDQGAAAFDAGRYADAYNIFTSLSERGDIAATRNVALMLRKGLGVEKDPLKAMEVYERAADAGLSTAQADLGEMYLNGEGGAPDVRAAAHYLGLAAAAGHPIAQFHMGWLYENGTGVPKNMELATKLYQASAEAGDKDAKARLAALGLPELPELRGQTP